MGLFKLKSVPEVDESDLVVDLDQIITKPSPFRFNGKIHLIKPITTKEFFEATKALAKLDALRKKNQITPEELLDVYADLVMTVCDTLDKNEILKMNHSQVGALVQLIVDHITGKVGKDEKKNITPPTTNLNQ